MSIESSFNRLRSLAQSGHIAGSWLITGPYGVGKTTLIRRFVGYLLTGKEETLDFHQDLKWIERSLTEEEKKVVAQQLNSGKALDVPLEERAKKSEITIDDIRSGISFLSLTSANKNWRVFVIDSADDMNENAENALLKLLEEPPEKSIIFLISHNIGKLLPTIRSRCRQISVLPLNSPQTRDFILKNYSNAVNPELYFDFFAGSMGKIALFFENEGEYLYQQIQKIAQTADMETIFQLAEKVVKNEKMYDLCQDLILFYLLEKVKNPDLPHQTRKDCFRLFDESVRLNQETKFLYLDKKSSLISILIKLGKIK